MVPIVLSIVDRERNVLENDVTPGDVPRKSISTSPALEASTVQVVLHHNILEEDVLDRCNSTALAERADRKTVSTLTVVLHEIRCKRPESVGR